MSVGEKKKYVGKGRLVVEMDFLLYQGGLFSLAQPWRFVGGGGLPQMPGRLIFNGQGEMGDGEVWWNVIDTARVSDIECDCLEKPRESASDRKRIDRLDLTALETTVT
jgi:hypothetical protein